MSKSVVVAAAGCSFASGPTLALAEVATRANLCLTIRHPHYVDSCGGPIKGAFFAPRPQPVRRWLELADAAMRDLAVHLPVVLRAYLRDCAVALWLVLPAPIRPGRLATLEQALVTALGERWATIRTIHGGHAASVRALAEARTWMSENSAPALVLAVDSAWSADTLAWLEAYALLHGARRPYRGQARANPYGRIPGEGAAALLLAPNGLAEGWCTLTGLGQASEPLTFDTDGPCVGAGLSAAVYAALEDATHANLSTPVARDVGHIVHDANGEPYRGDEFGFTVLRLADHLADGWQRLAPALASGDLMTASLATHLAIAAWRMRISQSTRSPTLVLASSDDAERAAVLLTPPETP